MNQEIKDRIDTWEQMTRGKPHHALYQAVAVIKEQQTLIDQQAQEIESLKWKVAHPVMCQGICTSQLDDYCGMHMSNESCIACNSIWTSAHVENAKGTANSSLELAVKALEWYADQDNHDNGHTRYDSDDLIIGVETYIEEDYGQRAKDALKEIREGYTHGTCIKNAPNIFSSNMG